ncbi:transporter (plasmid) [Fulvitalea axinellae]|uniref:Transporter n=1 Tax=Fulvitalea axinellae TaxID=1182444 RepID=A0AAU9D1U7_9BACT|nr:transporter [Fulvitalea axinellae]
MRAIFRLFLLLVGGFLTFGSALAQDDSGAESKNDDEFTFVDFMKKVKADHPLALVSQGQVELGKAALMKARGGFDPKASFGISQKYFGGQSYYNVLDGGLKVPVWFGAQINAGIEQGEGDYVNPESYTPDAGLYYAEMSIPVGRGLFTDERRTALRKARFYTSYTEEERLALVNNLLYNAGKAYWQWFYAYHALMVREESKSLAENRLEAIRRKVNAGDKPAIDTLKALIQVQSRQMDLEQATADLYEASQYLSTFLWAKGVVPLELGENIKPSGSDEIHGQIAEDETTTDIETLLAEHPELRQKQLELDMLKTDRRLKKEMLKPQLDLKYRLLSEAVEDPENKYDFGFDNYKWGLKFGIPIFLRKERADLRKNRVKIEQAKLKIEDKRVSLLAKARTAWKRSEISARQVGLFSDALDNYRLLMNAELRLYDSGESSLFLVNTRELHYFDARIKLLKTVAENRKSVLAREYSLARLEGVY